MAVQSICGCDYFDDIANLTLYFKTPFGSITSDAYNLSPTGSKWSTGCVILKGSGSNRTSFSPLTAKQQIPQLIVEHGSGSTISVSFWVKVSSTGTPNRTQLLLFSGPTSSHGWLNIRDDGRLEYQRFTGLSSWTTFAEASTNITDGEWHFLEVVYVCSSTGSCTVKFDGSIVISYSGDTRDTPHSSSTTCNAIIIFAGHNSSGSYRTISVDDIVFATDTLFRGIQRIFTVTPSGDILTDWTATPGGNHYPVHTSPVSQSSYVQSAVNGQRELYTLPDANPNATGLILVQLSAFGSKTSNGQLGLDVVSGNTLFQGPAVNLTVGGFGLLARRVLETDPATTLPWTLAGFNALQAGFTKHGNVSVTVRDFIIETLALAFEDEIPEPPTTDSVFVRVMRTGATPAIFRYTIIK
jgi:hypothetical protein